MPRNRPDKGKSRVPLDPIVSRFRKTLVSAPRKPVTANRKPAVAPLQAAAEGTPAFRLNEALSDPWCV